MKKRKGSASGFILLFLFCYGIYFFFFRETEEPFVPYYYAEDGREIYYKESRDSITTSYTLAGVDAPYVARSSSDISSKPFGEEAKAFLQLAIKSGDLHLEVLNGNYVYAWLGKPLDSSDATIRNQMINALMISNGYSKYYPTNIYGSINPTYEKVFLTLQNEAQNKGIGIWSLPENSPEALAKEEARRLKEEKEAEERERKEKLAEEKEHKKKQQEYLKRANSVAVTPKGKKYHYTWCQTIKGSYKTITIKQAKKRGYKPCAVCEPPAGEVTLENSNGYWEDEVIRVYRGENQRILK